MLRLYLLRRYPTNVDIAFIAFQLYLIVNIVVALYPLFRPKDDLTDIPLTPTQRALLGLDPMATPSPTPGSTYVTPPRYRLSGSRPASPLSRTSPLSARKSQSPLSATASLSGHTFPAGTSFSPSTSPLLQKAVANGGRESGQRPSFGSPSPLRRGSFESSSPFSRSSSFRESTLSSLGPPTPSPTGRRGAGVALSNKWLYEKSRRLHASNGAFSL